MLMVGAGVGGCEGREGRGGEGTGAVVGGLYVHSQFLCGRVFAVRYQ